MRWFLSFGIIRGADIRNLGLYRQLIKNDKNNIYIYITLTTQKSNDIELWQQHIADLPCASIIVINESF